MTRGAIVLVIVAAHGSARADGPIAVTAAIGPSTERYASGEVTYYDGDNAYRGSTTLHLDLDYRVGPMAALGIHVGLSRAAALGTTDSNIGLAPTTYAPFEIGIGGTLVITDRVWLAPWVGVLDIVTVNTDFVPQRALAVGFDAGIDVYEQAGHRVAVFAGFTQSGDWGYEQYAAVSSNGYVAFTLGAAYRYW